MNSRIKTLSLILPMTLLSLAVTKVAYADWNVLFCDVTSGTSAQQIYNAFDDYNEDDADDRMCGAAIRILAPGTHHLDYGLKIENGPATKQSGFNGNTGGTANRRGFPTHT